MYFDQGRPVFASSNEPRDRMGELLVREGKITASQYERCQTVVAESGRRMGEILVDFGYLKRRELLPAVRRHVEDIVYSLFGWDRGHVPHRDRADAVGRADPAVAPPRGADPRGHSPQARSHDASSG